MLPIERETIAATKRRSAGIRSSDFGRVLIAGMFEEYGELSCWRAGRLRAVGRPFVDAICGNVTKEKISRLAFRNPHGPFAALKTFTRKHLQFGIRGENRIQRRIESHDLCCAWRCGWRLCPGKDRGNRKQQPGIQQESD